MVYIAPLSDEMLMNAPNSLAANPAAKAIWLLALSMALAGCGNRMVAQTAPAIPRPAASADNASSSDESQWPLFRDVCLSNPDGSFIETNQSGIVDGFVRAYATLGNKFEINYSPSASGNPSAADAARARRQAGRGTAL